MTCKGTDMIKFSRGTFRVLKSMLSVALFASSFTACVSSIDPGVELNKTLQNDQEYYANYQRATRGGDVIRDFGLEYRLHATYLYPEFKLALLKRVKDLYLQDAGTFSEAESKSAFFVTIYGSDRDGIDLANTGHWTILLGSYQTGIRPVLVRKITDKRRWGQFFETISPWTTDYLVVFDVPAANPGAANLVEKPHAKLLIAGAQGKVVLDW